MLLFKAELAARTLACPKLRTAALCMLCDAPSAAWPLTRSPRLAASRRLIISYSRSSCRRSKGTLHTPCLAPRTAAGGYCPRVNRVSEAAQRRRQLEAEGNKADQRSCCYPRPSQSCPSAETRVFAACLLCCVFAVCLLWVCRAHSSSGCWALPVRGAWGLPQQLGPALSGANWELHRPSAHGKGRHYHHPAGDVPRKRELRNAKQNEPAETGSLQNTFTQFCGLS